MMQKGPDLNLSYLPLPLPSLHVYCNVEDELSVCLKTKTPSCIPKKLLSFFESSWFFSYEFKNIKHLVTLVNSNDPSREPLIIFIALMVSPSANWRVWP